MKSAMIVWSIYAHESWRLRYRTSFRCMSRSCAPSGSFPDMHDTYYSREAKNQMLTLYVSDTSLSLLAEPNCRKKTIDLEYASLGESLALGDHGDMQEDLTWLDVVEEQEIYE